MKKAKYLLKDNFIILVADDSPLLSDENWSEVKEYTFTKEVAMILFQQDHTGVTLQEDGTYVADESAMERARTLSRFELNKVEDPGE
jgi:hypothetical protein|tara:strand:- start:585 stop:845 length:261 start_codon:yes stop_codon:yes gene_type:complete